MKDLIKELERTRGMVECEDCLLYVSLVKLEEDGAEEMDKGLCRNCPSVVESALNGHPTVVLAEVGRHQSACIKFVKKE